MATIISAPVKFSSLAANNCLMAISNAEEKEIAITFPDQLDPEPIAILYFINAVGRLKKQGRKFTYRLPGRRTYASHIGLYSALGAEEQINEDVRQESESYVSIRSLTRTHLNKLAREQRAFNVAETIEREAKKLALLLTRHSDAAINDALTYCLREIMRNSYEHSRAPEQFICAQYRPSADRVDLAFMDHGVGLLASLKENWRLTLDNESEATKLAMLPGISGNISPADDDPWHNSGYGLFITERICNATGTLTIISNDSYMRSSRGRSIERIAIAEGFILGISVRISELSQLNAERLSAFHNKGLRISGLLSKRQITASLASTTLKMVR